MAEYRNWDRDPPRSDNEVDQMTHDRVYQLGHFAPGNKRRGKGRERGGRSRARGLAVDTAMTMYAVGTSITGAGGPPTTEQLADSQGIVTERNRSSIVDASNKRDKD